MIGPGRIDVGLDTQDSRDSLSGRVRSSQISITIGKSSNMDRNPKWFEFFGLVYSNLDCQLDCNCSNDPKPQFYPSQISLLVNFVSIQSRLDKSRARRPDTTIKPENSQEKFT